MVIAGQLYSLSVLKLSVRKDLPRLAFLYGFFFMFGGYGPLMAAINGARYVDISNAIIGVFGTFMMATCVYFAVIAGRQIFKRYRLSLSPESST
jgi:hypothetical protein